MQRATTTRKPATVVEQTAIRNRRRRRGVAVGLALCLSALGAEAGAAERRADHVVLISIDGLRPEFYLDATWPAPRIQQMARDGASAEGVVGVFPSVTYPSHTSMVTGALPVRHGIYNNQPFEPGGQTGRWYWHAEAIRAETLWQAVRGAGGTTAAFSWPVSEGAPIDRVVPEIWALSGDVLEPMRAGSKPEGLWRELVERAAPGLETARFSIDYTSRDDVTGAAASYLFETYRPTLLAVHLIAVDHFEHADGRDSDRVRLAVAAADRAIATIVEGVQRAGVLDRTAFVVTGDHGFVELHTEVRPNVWLAAAGLTEEAPDRGDWTATFHTAGGAALLYTRQAGDAAAEAVAAARRAVDAQPERVQRLFRVVERDELQRLGADPQVAFALTGALGVSFSATASGAAVGPTVGGTHGYAPDDFPQIHTGFVGWGAGFASGRTVHRMRLVDIAPTVAELLGLDFAAPDGVAPLGVLTQAASD
ncbi:MAG: alkaline phosphatase family protein [Acidobacteria bacterium]|nr:MAG: alkaline phosphatase family protein [Acidobacteriota bacterium]REK09174.1 MAG: alkaline phosphatase family protein [Acidobacteriota bacterium]